MCLTSYTTGDNMDTKNLLSTHPAPYCLGQLWLLVLSLIDSCLSVYNHWVSLLYSLLTSIISLTRIIWNSCGILDCC